MGSIRVWIAVLISAMAVINHCFCSQVYVVYMGEKTGESQEDVLRRNEELLMAVHGGSQEQARESHVYSYTNAFRGFAAKLSDQQAMSMAGMEDVVSVFPSVRRTLHTTHSWDFMGLTIDEAAEIPGFSADNQENVIIGFIDTGIWPESPSFRDENMPPVPSRWKGVCQNGKSSINFPCNRKIIGARYYSSGFMAETKSAVNETSTPAEFHSPRDSAGHGTHTASTAAGRLWRNADFNGLGGGGARGGAPMARVAVYKACWLSGCYDSDILAAFDDAINDGVDLISVSLGPDAPQQSYFNDAVSIGSFHAAARGILVVSSVGNLGTPGAATNLAPWMITVAAGTTDRDFASTILLGDGTRVSGESLNVMGMSATARIIPASQANAGFFTPDQASFCLESSLDSEKARGKVLVCRHGGGSAETKVAKSLTVKNAGGVGMVLIDDFDADVAVPFAIPAASVGKLAGDRVLSYVTRTRNPTARIFPARTVIGSKPAPTVAAFSSKGPNSLTPEILKPDVAAPGLNILAAWSPSAKRLNSNVASGTSMACPHVAAIAAVIKAANPSWSPSAIKSAIMTTASVADPSRASPFARGSGYLDPTRALFPGLVYDSGPADFDAFLCRDDGKTRRLVSGAARPCPRPLPPARDLNYPAIVVVDFVGRVSVVRTVTNVGSPRIVYRSTVSPPPGVNVTVDPRTLAFSGYGQRIRFKVTFDVPVKDPPRGFSFGSLSWVSGDAEVRSPLIVRSRRG
ncbi:subtilisin-like serine-protease S [Wolffia australiana]